MFVQDVPRAASGTSSQFFTELSHLLDRLGLRGQPVFDRAALAPYDWASVGVLVLPTAVSIVVLRQSSSALFLGSSVPMRTPLDCAC